MDSSQIQPLQPPLLQKSQQNLSQQHRHTPQRGLLKLALEASPLQQAQIPPCNLRSVAIVNIGERDDRILIYLGTDSGNLLLFTWFRSSAAGLPSNAIPSSEPTVAETGLSESSKSTLLLTGNRNLGKSPVDCLCPLPRGGRIAALLDQQVVILDLHTLGPLEWLPITKGAFTLTRAFGSPESLQTPKGISSNFAGTSGRDGLKSPGTPKRGGGQGQLGRLFGSGRLSVKRGGWNLLTGEVGAAFQAGATTRGEAVDISTKNRSNAGSTKSFSRTSEVSGAFDDGIEKFAVALKQKLLLYEVRIGSQRKKEKMLAGDVNEIPFAVKVKDIPGPEVVVTMAWVGNVIITGNNQEYTLFSIVDGQASLLFSLPQDLLRPPLLKPFPKEHEVLLLIDSVGVGVNAHGQPTSSSLLFRDIPDAVGQSSSCVVVVKRGFIELYHRRTGAKVQSVVLSDTAMGPYLICDDDDGKYLVVSSALKVYCLERVPVDEQLKELLRQKQFNEAVELAEECVAEAEDDSPKERLAVVHAQAGFLLFFDLQFKEAVDHFLESSVMHPAETFPFFPSLTERWRSIVPRNRYWGLHPPPQAIHNVIEIKLQAIHRGLILQSVSSMNDLPNGPRILGTSSKSKSVVVEEHTMQATKQIIRYLKVARAKPLTVLTKEGVDTLLMKLLVKVGLIEEMEQLASSENSCLVEEVEDMLQASGNLRTLAFLYETKGMQSLALQVWQALAQGHISIVATPRTDIGDVMLTKGGVEVSSFKIAAAREASRLLETSSDSDLVLEHLSWILEVSEDLAFQILSSPKRSRALPPDDVLHCLGSSEASVQQRYLEWLVQEQGVEDSCYHTAFALSLAKSAIKNLADTVAETEEGKKGILTDAPSFKGYVIGSNKQVSMPQKTKNGVCNGLSSNGVMEIAESTNLQLQSDNQPVACASGATFSEHSTLPDNVRYRLQKFLESSEKYNASKVLALIEGSELWREQAILHRKLGDETSVFQILALKLEDTEAAERYCTELGRPEAYMRLLDMYLKPGDGREPMYNAAVHLLQRHGTALEPLQVLEALSPAMPLQLAYETVARMFRARVHLHREGQIVRHLTRAENLEARVARLEERARNIRITDQSSCGSCFARFGTKLFALYPNGSVVCYKCFRSSGSHIDPVTGHDFQKDPQIK